MKRAVVPVAVFLLGFPVILSACGDDAAPPFGASDGGKNSSSGSTGTFNTDPNDPNNPPPCAPAAGNYDFPGNNCDDDNDGTIDNPPSCDGNLSLDGDAPTFAQALGICQHASDNDWGLVSATYASGHATASGQANDGQHGILGKFGNVVSPREGAALGVLSSGWAREYDDPSGSGGTPFQGGEAMGNGSPVGPGGLPPGFPKAASGCQQGDGAYDVIDLKLQIKVPQNANGIQFDFNFWSGEWPEFVCTPYNDAFIAYLTSGSGGQNISFDKDGNPVSVNNGFFDRCTPGAQTGCAGGTVKTAVCPGGVAELAGTGFEAPGVYCEGGTSSVGGGATGWLTSQASVSPGETITLEFIIWDTGDDQYDSSVLLDHIQWVQGAVASTSTVRPPS